MVKYRFTGNPFVDAGIAGMCAAAEVDDPAELNEEAIHKAVNKLLRIFTSKQALEPLPKPGDEKKISAFATSELSAIFPNGPHANPSNKGEKKVECYRKQITELRDSLFSDQNCQDLCFACGKPATAKVTKMDFPLVESRRNFHPALSDGHAICAGCALAVQFLPFSVLRTSLGGLFWFVSSLDPFVAITPAATLSLSLLESNIAANRRIRFFGDWAIPGRASAVIGAVGTLTQRKHDLGIKKDGALPVRAVFFSNDNRGSDISVQDVPNTLFNFFSKLQMENQLIRRFNGEVLHIPKFGESVAQQMLNQQPIIRSCTVGGDQKNPVVQLLGGWTAHTLYMKEVLHMSSRYIRTIEDIALRISETDAADKELKRLKLIRQTTDWFLPAISSGLVTRQEFYYLVPPNNSQSGSSALDYIAGAAAEAIRCRDNNEEFIRWQFKEDEQKDDVEHPLIRLVEDTGEAIFSSGYDPGKLIDNLRKARYSSDLRWAWLRVLEAGVIQWPIFIDLVPPDDLRKPYAVRDYMLAYLYDRAGMMAQAIDDEEVEVGVVQSEYPFNEGSEEQWPTQ